MFQKTFNSWLDSNRIWLSVNFRLIALEDRFLGSNNEAADNKTHLNATVEWLKRAQDATGNGGVSAGYFKYAGWETAYPETTGYIIPTMFDYYYFAHDEDSRKRAIEMSDFLVNVQLTDGSFAIRPEGPNRNRDQKSGFVGMPLDPEVFDTGQCMQGLVRCYKETKRDEYLTCATKAGDWLVTVQDEDGAWRKHSFHGMPHTFYTRVALALQELHQLTGDKRHEEAAIKNIEWALTKCNEKGWYNNCIPDPKSMQHPITHFIAYTAEGILEAGILLKNENFIRTATATMNSLLNKFETDGWVSATYNENWESQDSYSCLTGDAQITLLWLRLFELTHKQAYYDGAVKLNNYIKSTQHLHHLCKGIKGGVKGSQPIYGKYDPYSYINWAAKFFVDSLLRQENLRN